MCYVILLIHARALERGADSALAVNRSYGGDRTQILDIPPPQEGFLKTVSSRLHCAVKAYVAK